MGTPDPRPLRNRSTGVAPLDHSSRHVAVAALVIVLAIVSVVVANRGGTQENGRAPVTTAAASTQPSASLLGLEVASVPEVDELAVNDDDLEIYSLWAQNFVYLSAGGEDAGPDLASLARDYGGSADDTGLIRSIPGKGRAVRVELGKARRHLRAGERALDRERYTDARRHFRKATDALKTVRQPVRRDLTALEREAGARIVPGGVLTRQGSYQSATVERWIDGDTVETSLGRVRVLGIDTPEMGQSCGPARDAQAAAEQLAPPGSTVRLFNPVAVRDTDRYGRLLRFVDTTDPGGMDIGLTLLTNNLAQPRYDSRDGYQWHPREAVYRATDAQPARGEGCVQSTEAAAFVRSSTLARSRGTHEYRRALLLQRDLSRPYRVAAKVLPRHVSSVQRADERAERQKRARAAARQAARRREAQRREAQRSQTPPPPSVSKPTAPRNPYPGYTGPRCYAPGGKTWKPC